MTSTGLIGEIQTETDHAVTVVNAQTIAGLVISRNPADGAEVTHVDAPSFAVGTPHREVASVRIDRVAR